MSLDPGSGPLRDCPTGRLIPEVVVEDDRLLGGMPKREDGISYVHILDFGREI